MSIWFLIIGIGCLMLPSWFPSYRRPKGLHSYMIDEILALVGIVSLLAAIWFFFSKMFL
jgi:hypothetical protein